MVIINIMHSLNTYKYSIFKNYKVKLDSSNLTKLQQHQEKNPIVSISQV